MSELRNRVEVEHACAVLEKVWKSPRLREVVAASLETTADYLDVLRWLLGDTSDPKFEVMLHWLETKLFFAEWGLEEADALARDIHAKGLAEPHPEDPEE